MDSQPVEYWRWEFIRRDIGYRKVWLDYQANKEAWDCRVDNELSRSAEEGSRYNLDHMISPAIPYNQWVSLYVHSSCPVALPIREEMDAVVDFAQNNGHLLTAINPYECFERQFEVIRQSVNSLKKEYFFEDLRWPQRNKWPLYLRMLDARDDLRNYVDLEELGLEPKDFKVPSFGRIAEVFKQGTQSFKVTRQSVSKQHKAAVAAQNKFVSCIPVSPTK